MAILSHPAFGPRTALAYITVGTLMDVWTAVWYFAYIRGAEKALTNTTWFWLVGLFLTGLTLVIIGMLLGPIGQAARRAELPPSEALPSEAAIQKTAAANPANPLAAAQVAPAVPPGYVPAPPVPGVQAVPGVPGVPAAAPYGS